jgi:hypothetical protein
MKRVIVLGLAMVAAGCGSEFTAAEDGGVGGKITPGATGAAEFTLRPPRIDVPNIGARTYCAAGISGTYTYLVGERMGGETRIERVASAMVPSGKGFAVSCQIVEAQDDIFITAQISGRDGNTGGGAAALKLSGAVPRGEAFGALDSGAIESDDTGPLASDPEVASCVLEDLSVDDARGLTASVVCPALVGNDELSGCELTGAIAFAGCSG